MSECNNSNTNNETPVGIGYDSRGRARSLMELSSISIASISATNYYGISAVGGITELSELSDTCIDSTPSNGQVLVWSTTCWTPSSLTSSDLTSLSSLVSSIEASTISLSGYINANEPLWTTGTSVVSEPFVVTGTPTNLSNYSVITGSPSITLTYPSNIVAVSVSNEVLNNISTVSGNLNTVSGNLNTVSVNLNTAVTATTGQFVLTGGGGPLNISPTATLLSPYALTSTLSNYALTSTLSNYALDADLDSHVTSASVHFTAASLAGTYQAVDTLLTSLTGLGDSLAAGDMLYSTGAGTLAILTAAGVSEGSTLKMISGTPTWVAPGI